MRDSAATRLLPHAVAATATVTILALGAGMLLWTPPVEPRAASEGLRVQLRLLPRREVELLPAPAAPQAAVTEAAARVAPAAGDPLRAGAPASAAASPVPASGGSVRADAPGSGVAAAALYDDQGRIRLPSSGPEQAASVPDPMRRDNPVDYRGTRFEQAWATDGDLGEAAGQSIARGQRKVAELLLGKDIQHARARPAPEVRFDPARHERPSDLGSEATGDAWRAAPISAEPVPGLDGRASRSIREEVAALERGYARCPRARMEQLMVPVRRALEELQAAEHALAKGADPVRARHQLPNAANSAWDQARRGLWYARQQLSGCGG